MSLATAECRWCRAEDCPFHPTPTQRNANQMQAWVKEALDKQP